MNSFTKIIILLHLIGAESACDNCDYCAGNKCSDPDNDVCKCEYGCKPGYFGNQCLNACPEQCFTCGREYGKIGDATQGICYECNDGYHNGSSKNCLCPNNCQQCTSITQCTLCNQGLHGTMCQSSCSTNCKDLICHITDGSCTNGCIEDSFVGDYCDNCRNGFYGDRCKSSCHSNCKDYTCRKSDGYCSNGCNDGWYGTKCDQECPAVSACKDKICRRIDGVCHFCIPGKYGLKCDTECLSSTCIMNECDRVNGLCTNGCSGNFVLGTDNLCQTCIAGKYRDTCDNDCYSKNCKNNKCDKVTGTCIDKCIDNFVLGSDRLCETCKPGKYDKTCNKDCPINCFNSTCNQDNGTCTDECISSSFIGEYCDKCKIGLYGSNCDLYCPLNCKDNVCTRSEGHCEHGCITDNFDGMKCDECKTGLYGEQCTLECPKNCRDDICSQLIGQCIYGCKGNFTGSKCEDCANRYYGYNCNLQCLSDKCYNNKCIRDTGKCEQCLTSWYGELCDVKCSEGCAGKKCSILEGICVDRCRENYTGDKCCVQDGFCEECDNETYCSKCEDGYYGETCSTKCPQNCQQSCLKSNGHCLACNRGYFGSMCELACPVFCKNVTYKDICDFEDGTCLEGCVNGYFKNVCDGNCSTYCLDSVCNQATGKCDACVTGFHGDTCQYECSTNCLNVTCSQDNAECFLGCYAGFQGQTCQQALRNEDVEGNSIAGPVAGSVSTVIVAIVIGVIVVILLRKWKKKKDEDKTLMNTLYSTNDGSRAAVMDSKDANAVNQNDSMDLVVNQVQIDIEDDDEKLGNENDVNVEYANAPLSTTNIRVIDLYTFVTQTEYEHFEKEFERLPRSTSHSYACARKPENRGLNRFKGMFPYDHSRVKLKHDPTFFINACYIDVYKREKAYIASVGPTAAITNNFISFWTMVWYENVDKIVILTRLREETGMKCERYWPIVGESKVYGDITVSHQEINTYAEYTITVLLLEKGNQQRSLTHIHYTAWPDKTIPDNVVSLVEFYNLVNSIKSISGGPTIVHCSAGVGRTGTFIALDILTEQGKSEKCVNVYECVMSLREQRMCMVQTHEQYEYLHRCLIYTLLFDSDPVTTDYVQSKLSMLDDRSYTNHKFKMFDNDVERKSQDDVEAIEGNKKFTDKNRPGADIPGNRNRPRLYLNRSFNQPDYINAVYVNSFKRTNHFIVAQTPLPETLSDFLCLLYQTNCTCVVDMDDPVEHNKSTIGVYQPEVNESIQVDTYTISCTKSETNSEFIKSLLKLKNSSKQNPGEITITHYKYTGWKQNTNVPKSVNSFVQFVNTVQVATDNQTEDSPIITHCLNGYERSGLFCTMSIMLEKLECEQQISIDNTIRQVRLRRTKAIPNKAQYKFCFQCIASFSEMFNTYSNFAM